MAPAIDFGCHHVGLAAALPGALLVAILFFLLAGLGSAVGGRSRWAPADVVTGWGVIIALFTIGGIYIPSAMPALGALAGLLSLVAICLHLAVQGRAPWPVWLIIAVAGQIWILTLINYAGVSGWDDIAQWVQNALFLWQHNNFPDASLPTPYSNRPAYPYALAYLDYIVSLGQGVFVMQAGAMINWLLLASFAWALTAFEDIERSALSAFMRLGVALAVVTLLNPGFNASFTVTGQSDTATSVAVGFLGLLLLHLHSALRENNRERIRAIGWQIAMTSIALVLLRDMNIILLILLSGASLLLALRERKFVAAICAWTPALMFSMIAFVAWREYSQHAMTHDDVAPLLNPAEWRWSLMPQLLHAAGTEMVKKNGFYGMMLGTTAFGMWAFVRGKPGKYRSLGVLTAVVLFGYTGFILTAFIAYPLFTENNITHAMSFYRYGTHTGMLGVAMVWFLFEQHVEPRIKGKAIPVIAVLSLGLLPLAYAIKPGWLVPQSSASLCRTRTFGDELARRLPPQSRLAFIDSRSDGFEPYIVNLELALDDLKTGNHSQIVASMSMLEPEKLAHILEQAKTGAAVNALLIRHPTDELKQDFKLGNDDATVLLIWNGEEWKQKPTAR